MLTCLPFIESWMMMMMMMQNHKMIHINNSEYLLRYSQPCCKKYLILLLILKCDLKKKKISVECHFFIYMHTHHTYPDKNYPSQTCILC